MNRNIVLTGHDHVHSAEVSAASTLKQNWNDHDGNWDKLLCVND